MNRRKRVLLIFVGVIVFIPIALAAVAWVWWDINFYDSKIFDFRPTDFPAQAGGNFFYSIGNELKYASSIDPKAPTLLRGRISEFKISPDGARIAVVADSKLQIVESGSVKVLPVTPVDTIFRETKPVGRAFFRDQDFQWSRDGKFLFLIKDEYYESKGLQLFSDHGELWMYSLETGALQPVLKSFPAYNYFFGIHGGIYFSVPTPEGNLQLKYYNGSKTVDIADPKVALITSEGLSHDFVEQPFHSFNDVHYTETVLAAKGVTEFSSPDNKTSTFRIRGKDLLRFSEGNGLKGHYFCDDISSSTFLPSTFLPEDRYFLLNVYCGNYEGQLLVDTATGRYKTLPKDTRVYRIFNTETYPHFRINGGGIEPELFSSWAK